MVNISSTQLSSVELSLLSRGLSFCPTTKTDWFGLDLNLVQFLRRLKLSVCFDGHWDDRGWLGNFDSVDFCMKDYDLYVKREFNPPLVSHFIEFG